MDARENVTHPSMKLDLPDKINSSCHLRLIACAVLLFVAQVRVNAAEAELVDYANILQGTDSSVAFSHGNTLPLVGMPWGMVAWSIQNAGGAWFFKPNGTFGGFRATHQPSPWNGDYGQFMLLPESRPGKKSALAYDTSTAILRPDYERIDLTGEGITAELTSTDRCGVFRLTYHEGKTGRLTVKAYGGSEIRIDSDTLYGISRANAGGVPGNFASYFVIKLDRQIIGSDFNAEQDAKTVTNGPASNSTAMNRALPAATASLTANPPTKGKDVSGYLEFRTSPGDSVLVKAGTSYISWQQAEQNMRAETEGTFDAIHDRVAAAWNANLGKIAIDATEEQKKTFYSCLYRAQIFPQRLFELDAAGKPIHYSVYDGKIHSGVLYGNIGIWDAFRTTFPLVTLVYPEQLDEILQGFVNASLEGDGTLPEWPSPGYRRVMIGQHCAAVFADALAKGHTGFDVTTAYDSLRKSAFQVPTRGMMVRDGMADYLKLGYTPGIRYSVSTALDYAYDDWCVAQMAMRLNHPGEAKALMARAQNYRKLWDPSAGFMRDKKADGTWVEPFDEFAWGGPYAESGPWQASWFVPHDPAGLTSLVGGREQFAAKLDKLFSLPPTYHVGGYRKVIHEMIEMAGTHLGQCALNNQPSFDIPYLFAAIGQPWKTQYWTRRACAELFNSTPKGFPGDEDNGAMASWYILSSIGLYPFCPGSPEYLVTSPVFPKVTIHLAGNKTLLITSLGNSDKNVYIQKRQFNGAEDTKTWMGHQDISRGGSLRLEMGSVPKTESIRNEDIPYSASIWQ